MNKPHQYCLLVEDDPEDQELFIDALHRVSENAGCYAVSNGEEALHALLVQNITPDYIFTDINMPNMNGLEFLKVLKGLNKFSHIPVIIYSGEVFTDHATRLRELGASAFYKKTRFIVLQEILRKYFKGENSNCEVV